MGEALRSSRRWRPRTRRAPRAAYAAALACAAATAGCSGGAPAGHGNGTNPALVEQAKSDLSRRVPDATGDAVAALVQGNTRFAFDLFHELAADDNLLFAPQSISTALAMLYAGAGAGTKTELQTALHFGDDDAELNAAFNTLDQALEGREDDARTAAGNAFRLSLVNAAWAQKGYAFLPSYLDVLAQNYGAGLNLVDFRGNAAGARDTINRWVSAETAGKIPELVTPDSLSGNVMLVLTNAVYFKAVWASPFDPNQTVSGGFSLLDGSSADVPLMHAVLEAPFVSTDAYQAAELDYAGGELSMLVVVPAAGTFVAFRDAFDATALEQVAASLAAPSELGVTLPRFHIQSKWSLPGALGALGVDTLFSGRADLSGIDGSNDLFVKDVIHQAFADVNETGTEAAGGTAVVIGKHAVASTLDATRPLLFVIRDKPTGAVLFMGALIDPRD